MWYTLTGNFGDLLPINYWTKPSLIRKYHSESLDLKNVKPLSLNIKKKTTLAQNTTNRIESQQEQSIIQNKNVIPTSSKCNRKELLDLNFDSYESLLDSDEEEEENMSDFDSDYEDEDEQDQDPIDSIKQRNSHLENVDLNKRIRYVFISCIN